jgi:hypothetical protein
MIETTLSQGAKGMRPTHRRHLASLFVLVSALLVQAFATGCSKGEDRSASGGSPSQAAAPVDAPAATVTGPVISRAGINPPKDATFTCWIVGSGLQNGDKVLVNGTTEIATTFGNPELVTFVGDAGLLEGRDALVLVVFRPGTDLRSSSIEAPVPAGAPKG